MDRKEAMKEDETMSEADSLDSSTTSPPKKEKILTGRGVTLSMLMADGVVEPAKECLSIEYLGKKFTADLMEDGRIMWGKDQQVFNSPSAWAIYIKALLNPGKRSGCGWASVKYNGEKLDMLKSRWFRNMKIPQLDDDGSCDSSPLENGTNSPSKLRGSEAEEEDGEVEGSESGKNRPHLPVSKVTRGLKRKLEDENDNHTIDHAKVQTCSHPTSKIVKYSSLKKSQNLPSNTLVKCMSFANEGKLQPFTISVTTNCLLIVDFHCHLTTSEVIGYLAGKWDPETQHMSILQAFPCRCRLGEKQSGIAVETEIRKSMQTRGLQLVGWYHSHPFSPAHPSVRDIESQMSYQLKLKGEGMLYQPCVALICAPFNQQKITKESHMRAVLVMPPEEPLSGAHGQSKVSLCGMPMDMNFTWQRDIFLTQEVLAEMKYLVEFYKDGSDMVLMKEAWYEDDTFLDKLKGSLVKKFPKDRSDKRLLEYIDSILT